MKHFIILLLISFCCSVAAEQPPVLAHYMPWYASKEHSGEWGWHWTMNHFDPDQIKWTGDREAASHDYPLMGLYDSGDPHLLEAHVLLMKFAGIEGVIIDWYGVHDFYDYAQLHRNTQALKCFRYDTQFIDLGIFDCKLRSGHCSHADETSYLDHVRKQRMLRSS